MIANRSTAWPLAKPLGLLFLSVLTGLSAAAPARAGSPGAPPVILVHGYCGSPDNFDRLPRLLRRHLQVPVASFDYSDASGIPALDRVSIEKIAGRFARFLAGASAQLESPTFAVVAHSLGGLVVRAWMARMADPATAAGGLTYQPGVVRRVVFVGTPHYGVYTGTFVGRQVLPWLAPAECDQVLPREGQAQQVHFGSRFLSTLHDQWRAGAARLPLPRDMMSIIGCGSVPSETCVSDDAVYAASAALPVSSPDTLNRYVPRDHLGLDGLVHVD